MKSPTNIIDIKGARITIDAAGCQKEIVEKIVDNGGKYLIAVKGNQKTLRNEAENFFEQARQVEYEGVDCQTCIACEKEHGRIEERRVAVTNDLDWLDIRKDWKGLCCLIEVSLSRKVKGKVWLIDKSKNLLLSIAQRDSCSKTKSEN